MITLNAHASHAYKYRAMYHSHCITLYTNKHTKAFAVFTIFLLHNITNITRNQYNTGPATGNKPTINEAICLSDTSRSFS